MAYIFLKWRITREVGWKHRYRVGNLRSVHCPPIPCTPYVAHRNVDGGRSVEVRFADTSVSTCSTPWDSLYDLENTVVSMLILEQQQLKFEDVS